MVFKKAVLVLKKWSWSQWRSKGVKWGHAPRGVGLGGASTHFIKLFKTRF